MSVTNTFFIMPLNQQLAQIYECVIECVIAKDRTQTLTMWLRPTPYNFEVSFIYSYALTASNSRRLSNFHHLAKWFVIYMLRITILLCTSYM